MYKLMLKIALPHWVRFFVHIYVAEEIFVDYHLDRLTNTRLVMQPPKDERPCVFQWGRRAM